MITSSHIILKTIFAPGHPFIPSFRSLTLSHMIHWFGLNHSSLDRLGKENVESSSSQILSFTAFSLSSSFSHYDHHIDDLEQEQNDLLLSSCSSRDSSPFFCLPLGYPLPSLIVSVISINDPIEEGIKELNYPSSSHESTHWRWVEKKDGFSVSITCCPFLSSSLLIPDSFFRPLLFYFLYHQLTTCHGREKGESRMGHNPSLGQMDPLEFWFPFSVLIAFVLPFLLTLALTSWYLFEIEWNIRFFLSQNDSRNIFDVFISMSFHLYFLSSFLSIYKEDGKDSFSKWKCIIFYGNERMKCLLASFLPSFHLKTIFILFSFPFQM